MTHTTLRCKNCPKGGKCEECRRLSQIFDSAKYAITTDYPPVAHYSSASKLKRAYKRMIKRLKERL